LFSQTRYLGSRKFVHEGILIKPKSGRKLFAYLFNDLLLLAQPKSGNTGTNAAGRAYQYSLYRKPFPLNESSVLDFTAAEKMRNGFGKFLLIRIKFIDWMINYR
jgi:hypothetical protein